MGESNIREILDGMKTLDGQQAIRFNKAVAALIQMLKKGYDPDQALRSGHAFKIKDKAGSYLDLLPLRYIKPPPANVVDWLRRLAKDNMQYGGGHREKFACEAWEFISFVSGLIPVGVEIDIDILDSRKYIMAPIICNSIKLVSQNALDAVGTGGAEFQFRDSLWQAILVIKAFELSDTPCWYSLSEGLTYSLLATRLKGIATSDIHLPFPGTLIEIPKGVLEVSNLRETSWSIRTIGLMEAFDSPSQEDTLVASICLVPTGKSVGGGITYWTIYPIGSFDEVEDLIEYVGRRSVEESVFSGGPTVYVAGSEISTKEFVERVGHLIFNALTYFTSDKADISKPASTDFLKQGKSKKKLTKKQRKTAAARKFTLWEECAVGTHIVLNSEIKRAAGSVKRSGRKGWTMTYSHVVPGHFKMQPYGPGRSLRKRIWIEPYVRGRDLHGRIMGHTYSADSSSAPVVE